MKDYGTLQHAGVALVLIGVPFAWLPVPLWAQCLVATSAGFTFFFLRELWQMASSDPPDLTWGRKRTIESLAGAAAGLGPLLVVALV